MRHIQKAVLASVFMFLAAGPCLGAGTETGSETGTETAADTHMTTETGAGKQESLEKQWSRTVESLRSYSAKQRDKALEAGKKTLDAMDERIDKLEAWTSEHWSTMSTEARKKSVETLDEMRRQRNKVAEWYGGMKHSSAEAWDGVKQGFINSYDKLQSIYSNATRSSGSQGKKDSSD
ncbi:MAG: hypothetical protein WB783_16790 [Arenicellales bacterium]